MNIELLEDRKIKSISAVLKDHPKVSEMSKSFFTEKHQSLKKLVKNKTIKMPSIYSGKLLWKKYLLKNDGYGYFKCSPLAALCECISDRMSLFSLGDLRNADMSPLELICFKDVFLNKLPKEEGVKSQTNIDESIFSGLSIYDAAKAIYTYGLTTKELFNEKHLFEFGVKVKDLKTIDDLDKVSVEKIEGKERNYCFDKLTARRSFSIRGLINIENDIEAIKCEIYKNGPVVAGFVVYEDFINEFVADYDNIYTGPKEGSKPVGGHFVRLNGWGKDENGREYWVCCNNWSEWGNWGGYFKIYMNIKECMMEDNIVAPVVDLGDVRTFGDYNLLTNTGWESKVKPANKRNFYALDTIKLIKDKKINGNLSYFIKDKEFYPVYEKFYANNVSKYKSQSRTRVYIDFYNYSIDYEVVIISLLLGIVLAGLILMFGLRNRLNLK